MCLSKLLYLWLTLDKTLLACLKVWLFFVNYESVKFYSTGPGPQDLPRPNSLAYLASSWATKKKRLMSLTPGFKLRNLKKINRSNTNFFWKQFWWNFRLILFENNFEKMMEFSTDQQSFCPFWSAASLQLVAWLNMWPSKGTQVFQNEREIRRKRWKEGDETERRRESETKHTFSFETICWNEDICEKKMRWKELMLKWERKFV